MRDTPTAIAIDDVLRDIAAADPNACLLDPLEVAEAVLKNLLRVSDFDAYWTEVLKDVRPQDFDYMPAPRWAGPWVGTHR